jgi:translation initiation factor 1 (eIF-1/SUI1)
VTVVRGLVLDAIALTTTGKQLRAACGAAGTITMYMGRTGRYGVWQA